MQVRQRQNQWRADQRRPQEATDSQTGRDSDDTQREGSRQTHGTLGCEEGNCSFLKISDDLAAKCSTVFPSKLLTLSIYHLVLGR